MITQEDFHKPFLAPELDELFELMRKKKRDVQQYSSRYKKNVKFYSIHKAVDHDTHACAVSGPATDYLRFTILCDERGYRLKMIVGIPTEQNIKTMIAALQGMVARLKAPKPKGFDTSNWVGHYLWAEVPDDDARLTFDEAIALGLMAEEFAELCLEWGMSIRRYPLA